MIDLSSSMISIGLIDDVASDVPFISTVSIVDDVDNQAPFFLSVSLLSYGTGSTSYMPGDGIDIDNYVISLNNEYIEGLISKGIRDYSLDFDEGDDVISEIVMFDSAIITDIITHNVNSLYLTISGTEVKQLITANSLPLHFTKGDVLIWEIDRTNYNQLAVVGIKCKLS